MKAYFNPGDVYRACNRLKHYRVHVHPPEYGPIESAAEPAMWLTLAGNHCTLIGNVVSPKGKKETFLRPLKVEGIEELPQAAREDSEKYFYQWVIPVAKLQDRALKAKEARMALVLYDEGYNLLLTGEMLKPEEVEAEVVIVG